MHPALYVHISLFIDIFTAFLTLAPIEGGISVHGEMHLIDYLSTPGSGH